MTFIQKAEIKTEKHNQQCHCENNLNLKHIAKNLS